MPIKQEHKQILLRESENKTLPEWVEYFDNEYTKKQIYNYCYHQERSIKKLSKEELSKIQSKNARKYKINEDYFKKWSSNMAYILGFWFADGCIYGGRLFDITVHKKDKYILKKIADEFEYKGKVTDYTNRQACRINFSCKVMYDDLVSLGGTERKSNTISFPNVPKEYLPDFIRGYFDGDGCIMRLKNNRVNSAFTSGSRKFLESLLEILKEEAGVIGGSFDDSCCSLKFGKKDTFKIGEYMYANNSDFYLKRKKEKFYQ